MGKMLRVVTLTADFVLLENGPQALRAGGLPQPSGARTSRTSRSCDDARPAN
jgi:hypothetical protein